jgi:hypothetical protein
MSEVDADRVAMLRKLDFREAMAFYNRTDPPMPHPRINRPDKVMVRVHAERINCEALTEEERQVSREWMAARAALKQR